MKILAVDDEELALLRLEKELRKVFTQEEIHVCNSVQEVNTCINDKKAESGTLDFAFLDVSIGKVSGFELAQQIRKKHPECRFVFCTSHSEYAMDAFRIYATGYLIKPVTADMIKSLLTSLGLDRVSRPRVFIRAFGNFDIFIDDSMVRFSHSKAKELLAYLVDRKGSGVTTPEAYSVLWEDDDYTPSSKDKIQHAKKDLRDTLASYGIDDIIISGWNSLAIDASKVNCDYYDYLNGKPRAEKLYNGEYMTQYSWAEHTVGSLEFH